MINNNNKGFSLVELTFALMITGMGILAIFHVFPSGLSAGRNAIAETRALEFSQAVFASYRYEIAKKVDISESVLEGLTPQIPGTEDNVFIKYQKSGVKHPFQKIVYPSESEPAEYINYRVAFEELSDEFFAIYLEVGYGKSSTLKKSFYTAIYHAPKLP